MNTAKVALVIILIAPLINAMQPDGKKDAGKDKESKKSACVETVLLVKKSKQNIHIEQLLQSTPVVVQKKQETNLHVFSPIDYCYWLQNTDWTQDSDLSSSSNSLR